MNCIRSSVATLAVLAITGLGIGATDALTPPAVAATITKSAILEDPVAPKVAPKGYDITIVQFADYNCGYCRRMHSVVAALIASDPKIRLVYRDWPIFGPVSVEAARAAIASQWQGKHEAFNAALYAGAGKLDSSAIRTAANRAGVNWPRLQADLVKHKAEIDALLARTSEQAPAIGLRGTPAFIIGAYLAPGALDLATLQPCVRRSRKHAGTRMVRPGRADRQLVETDATAPSNRVSPGTEDTRPRSPLWPRRICRARARPTPVPSVLVVKKGRKMSA